MFILDEVPDPVWNTSIGNSALPSAAGHFQGRLGDGVSDRFANHPELGVLQCRRPL